MQAINNVVANLRLTHTQTTYSYNNVPTINNADVVEAVADSRDDDTRAGLTIAKESGGVPVDTHSVRFYKCVCMRVYNMQRRRGRVCDGPRAVYNATKRALLRLPTRAA